MKLVIDWNTCVGHGRCYGLEPELFRPVDDEGRSELISDVVDVADPGIRARLTRAADNCPEGAISWTDCSTEPIALVRPAVAPFPTSEDPSP